MPNKQRIESRCMDLSFPRRNQSVGNLKARKWIINQFKEMDFEVLSEKFEFNEKVRRFYYIKFRILAALFLSLLIVFAIIFSITSNNLIRVVNLFFCLVLLITDSYLNSKSDKINKKAYKDRQKYFKKSIKEGENIYVKLEGSSSEQKKAIMFGAHYDSVSLRFDYRFNTFLYLLGFGAEYLAPLVGIIFYSFYDLISQFFWIKLILFLMFIVLLSSALFGRIIWFFNRKANQSEGAVDNASSVAVLLELAEIFRKEPPSNLDLYFLTLDAEEEGLFGAYAFVEKHIKELITQYGKDNILVPMLDGLGGKGSLGCFVSYGFPIKHSQDKGLYNLISQSAEELGFSMGSLWSPYPCGDSVAFAMEGINTIHLFATTLVSNTISDTKDRVSNKNMLRYTKILENFVRNQNRRIAN